MSILIVENSKNERMLLEHLLRHAGYDSIISTSSAREAFKILEQSGEHKTSKVDLILLDNDMLEMSGIEACRLIKSTRNIQDIPIIMVTAQSDASNLHLTFSAGAHDYINKPVKKFDLLPRVHSTLRLKHEMDMRKAREKELMETNRLLSLEKEKSERLLQNILPIKIANDLKYDGKTVPELFENVTIFFSDIINFTKLASILDPVVLIGELNELFTAFDTTMESHRCERIKTIGDAYLAVCGMPEKNPDHASNITRAAIEIIQYLNQRNKEKLNKWHIRVGIHSGSVVGSVVGIKKYIYDIFGDSVNIASRVQSNSESMKINISETTYRLINDKFHCIEREPIMVKGKGEMKMYFVEIPEGTESSKHHFTFSDLTSLFPKY